MEKDLEDVFNELKSLNESMHGKYLETLDIQRITQLLDRITVKENSSLENCLKFGQIIWNLSFTISESVLNCPNSLNWPLAIRLSNYFARIIKDAPAHQSLFRIENVQEATIAYKFQPDIPKAFATLLIAMVSQNHLTINDLESHALALLHFEWAKEELVLIEKCLTEIKAMLVVKLPSESELQLIIDWIAETVSAIIADMEG